MIKSAGVFVDVSVAERLVPEVTDVGAFAGVVPGDDFDEVGC